MEKSLVILTPLPQFRFIGRARGQRGFEIDDSMWILPLRRPLRGAMLNAAKAHGPTNDVLMLLGESEWYFLAQVPGEWEVPETNPIEASRYCPIATEILNRLHDCLLLFAEVPPPLFEPCWFSAETSARYRRITVIDVLHPGWIYNHQPTNIDWRSPDVEPVDVDLRPLLASGYWGDLRCLCQIDQLQVICIEQEKRNGLAKSAGKYARRELAKFAKLRMGPRCNDRLVGPRPTV